MPRRLVSYGDALEVLAGLGVSVREARRRDGLNQREVAAASGVPLNSISRFERGQDVSLANAMKLLAWLDGGARA